METRRPLRENGGRLPVSRDRKWLGGGADPIRALEVLFHSGSVPCIHALDANDDEIVNLADAIYSLGTLFTMGPPPPPPFPECGSDPQTTLPCESFPGC